MRISESDINCFIEKLSAEYSEISSLLLNAKTDGKRTSKKMLKINKIIAELLALKELLIDKPALEKNY